MRLHIVYITKYVFNLVFIFNLKEFFALGMANIVGSCFKCFVSCASLARTVIFESSGGKTQVYPTNN